MIPRPAVGEDFDAVPAARRTSANRLGTGRPCGPWCEGACDVEMPDRAGIHRVRATSVHDPGELVARRRRGEPRLLPIT